ncbi:MAG: hypothetical protein IPH18_02065 [Chitinophagaceae bacterium]|nr:hypothetical protein [Chitinophagaceae bacterium]
MKLLEEDFLFQNSTFSIIGLEITYPKAKVAEILAGIDDHVKKILLYHLYIDFAFMAGIFPGIASLSMLARKKYTSSILRKLLLITAFSQFVAWAFDITENLYLIKWTSGHEIGPDFSFYHAVVTSKWIIAIAGFMVGIFFLLKKQRKTIF